MQHYILEVLKFEATASGLGGIFFFFFKEVNSKPNLSSLLKWQIKQKQWNNFGFEHGSDLCKSTIIIFSSLSFHSYFKCEERRVSPEGLVSLTELFYSSEIVRVKAWTNIYYSNISTPQKKTHLNLNEWKSQVFRVCELN